MIARNTPRTIDCRTCRPVLVATVLAWGASLASAADVFPGDKWPQAEPAEVGMDAAMMAKAEEYALTGGGSGLVTRHGKLVLSWGDQAKRYDLKSTTKSIGVTALGLAIGDGKLKLSDQASARHPSFGVPPESNRDTGWLEEITLLHLATQTAGFEKPGGYAKLRFAPGTKWAYSDGGPNWLAECVTLAYQRDLRDVMFERVFGPLGIEESDLTWRNNAYRDAKIAGVARREFGSGISANVDAMARIGYLYLREGRWRDKKIIPAGFVRAARVPVDAFRDVPEVDPKQYGDASAHYGVLWWNNADGTLANVPCDAFWSWGLYDSVILVIPSLDIVAARAGKSWQRNWSGHYDVLAGFLGPIVGSVKDKDIGKSATGNEHGRDRSEDRLTASRRRLRTRHATVACGLPLNEFAQDAQARFLRRAANDAPYPPSRVITSVRWAPADDIIRLACGSDNWPITWAEDDRLYAAYGDGRGFKPFVPKKLSLGLARISGNPPDIAGENLRSATAEQTGDGARGKKASGMLMVRGVLYVWVRNADNSQLAWSKDHGRTWTWTDWRFTESFGCPTFLNFGKNYAGARDEYVYVYSHDNDSAYRPASRMVLARVPQDSITDREAYEFFEKLRRGNKPFWTADITRRGAVFEHEGACYRSSISYNAPLRRYLWCQIIPGGDTRFRGGLGIYDAAEPWGPWTTVYFTRQWDVGPGETAGLPTKWISDDGRTLWLTFSGNDCFSVRKLEVSEK